MTKRSDDVIAALEKEFVYIIQGSSDKPVRCSNSNVNAAIAHIRVQDEDIERHRALLEAKDKSIEAWQAYAESRDKSLASEQSRHEADDERRRFQPGY